MRDGGKECKTSEVPRSDWEEETSPGIRHLTCVRQRRHGRSKSDIGVPRGSLGTLQGGTEALEDDPRLVVAELNGPVVRAAPNRRLRQVHHAHLEDGLDLPGPVLLSAPDPTCSKSRSSSSRGGGGTRAVGANPSTSLTRRDRRPQAAETKRLPASQGPEDHLSGWGAEAGDPSTCRLRSVDLAVGAAVSQSAVLQTSSARRGPFGSCPVPPASRDSRAGRATTCRLRRRGTGA